MIPEIYTSGLDVIIIDAMDAAKDKTARPATNCSFRVDSGKSFKGCSLFANLCNGVFSPGVSTSVAGRTSGSAVAMVFCCVIRKAIMVYGCMDRTRQKAKR